MPTLLALAPDQAGYSVTEPEEVLAVQLDGGLPRFRQDLIGGAKKVTVQWTIGPADYSYLKAFYRTTVGRGAEAFLVDLILDEPVLTQHEAYFNPGTMKLTGVQGLTYTVKAELFVKPIAPDTEYDEALVELVGIYGTDTTRMLNLFEEFANVTLPEYFG